jgi:hypothetical protein
MHTEHSNQSHPEPALVFLARESQVSLDEVALLYENELSKLEVGARIQNFLPIFAVRKVREMLLQRSNGKRPLP